MSTSASNQTVATAAVDYDPFAEGELQRVVPTTEPQREIWLADQLGTDASLAFNESVSLRFGGALDVVALRQALQVLVARHDALRATVGPDGATLCIREQVDAGLQIVDLSAEGTEAGADRLEQLKRAAVETHFDLQHDDLFRSQLVRLSGEDHVLILTAHHIVCDGWSWWVMVRELAALYNAGGGTPAELAQMPEQFADYALAEAGHDNERARSQDEAYWLSRFAEGAPVLELPTDRSRPARRSFASMREDYVLDKTLVAAIRKLGAQRGASLFATLLATFATLLSRLAGQDRIVVGIPAAGQSVDGHENLVGHCVNALPLLFDLDLKQGAGKAIDDAQQTLLDALEHQRYTFGTLLRKIRIERDPARAPLVSVMFNIDQALDQQGSAFNGLQLDFSSNARSYENFEIFLNAVQVEGEIRLECQYNTGLFDTTTIRHWMGHWRTMLEALVGDPSQALGRLPLLTEIERRQILERWNDTRADYGDRCVHELFEEQVERTPSAPALSFEGRTLSYAELNASANRLARHLRMHGVGPGQRVALCAERGVDMVVAMLAVLKAGGAYVPCDPSYPRERLSFMLGDSAPRVLLHQRAFLERLAGAAGPDVVFIEIDGPDRAWKDHADGNFDRASVGVGAQDLAYVIYTSGSTGTPKGTMLEHGAVHNYLEWAKGAYAPVRGSIVSSSFAFDATVTSLFTPLLCGGMVRMLPERQEIDGMLTLMQAEGGCGLVKITPAHLDALGQRLQVVGGRTGVDVFVVGGEALSPATVQLWRELQPGVRIVNEYGPTETVVGCCVYDIGGNQPLASSIPIGRAITNMRMYILDAFGQPVPYGVTGEIHIGGASVARGYLNRDALTAERFVPDPFVRQAGARMYKTGDLGRLRADGNIEYMGRNDFQVKIRGYRVELGEVENTLVSHPGVTQAVAVVRQDRPGDSRLVAYVTTNGAAVDHDALMQHLQTALPAYMVPQHLVQLAEIPLTSNGKVDRKALPPPDVASQGSAASEPPRNALESQVARAMSQVLGTPNLGIHDDFFALGGHSLLAAQLTTRLNGELGVRLSLRSVFDTPTVAGLADTIAASQGNALPPREAITRRLDQRRSPLSMMQERLRLIEFHNPGSISYNGPSGHRLSGPLDAVTLNRAFRLLAQRQTILRTTISEEGGVPVQVLHDDIEPGLANVHDLSALPVEQREQELSLRMRELVEVPFSDLSKAPLFVARLFKLAHDEHVLFFMPHHVIWDGWSFDLLYNDVSEIYAALTEDREPRLPELPVTYGDFSVWHNEWLQGPEYAAQVAFWRERLGAGGHNASALPTDKPRRRGMSGKSKAHQIDIDAALTADLHAMARGMDVTVFVSLLTAYYALLARMSGQDDLVIGTPVRGRNVAEVEGLMGYFTTLLPLRLQIDVSEPFRVLAKEVRSAVLESFANPDIRLEDLTRELNLRSDGGGAMLYQALFSFQDIRQRVTRWGNLQHRRVEVFQPGATEDLGLWFVEEEKGLTGGLIYNSDIFHDHTTDVFVQRYVELLRAAVRDPSRSIESLTRFEDGHGERIGEIAPATSTVAVGGNSSSRRPRPGAASGILPRSAAQIPESGVTSSGTGRLGYLLGICKELLGTEVAPGDNFFDMGGNSMLAVQAAERIFRDTGVRIKLMRFALQNLEEIAEDLPQDNDANVTPRAADGWLKRLFGGQARERS